METSNILNAKFKTLIVKMLKEVSEYLNSMKMILSEMKDELIKVKNNLQGINSRMDEAVNQTSNLE